MWWLAVPVVVGAAVAVWKHFDGEAKEARERWDRDRKTVERSLKDHRRNLDAHLSDAQDSVDFQLLCDLHFSSHRVGDAAYQLLNDARVSGRAMKAMLAEIRVKGRQIDRAWEQARSPATRSSLEVERTSLIIMYDAIALDFDTVGRQAEELSSEVAGMNAQTRELKLAIRDRCGRKGREWFERLEERTAARRQKRAAQS